MKLALPFSFISPCVATEQDSGFTGASVICGSDFYSGVPSDLSTSSSVLSIVEMRRNILSVK